MTPEQLLDQFSDRGVQLNQHLDDDTVLIEAEVSGVPIALVSGARQITRLRFQVGPSGAGSALFTDAANLGLYVHRVPCEHSED